QTYFATVDAFKRFALRLIYATALTGIVGEALIKLVEHTMFKGAPKAEIEELFGRLDLVAPALACAGILILIAGLREKKQDEAQAAANRQRGHAAGGLDGIRTGTLPSLSRLLAVGSDHLRRNADRREQAACGEVQLCAGGGDYAVCDCARGSAPAACNPRGSGERISRRPAWDGGDEPAGSGVCVSGRVGGAEVAEQLAGEWPLDLVRNLLPGGQCCGLVSALWTTPSLAPWLRLSGAKASSLYEPKCQG